MERLTDKNWRNFDIWETCGHEHDCNGDCHNPPCIVPRIYFKLAEIEDKIVKQQKAKKLKKIIYGITPRELMVVMTRNISGGDEYEID